MVLTFFALSLPMIEGLLVAAAILIIYRIRVKHDDEEAIQ
ncbi:YlaH-like family protein [Streptococcus mutans]|nr:YlaH-like family protein [Streptococcus mutans]